MSHDDVWANYAACKNTDPGIFFSKLESKVLKARAMCAGCPARKGCGEAALKEEGNVGDWGRHGIRAFMTPEQRAVIAREGGLRGRDPMDVVLGIERRQHKRTLSVPIADDGGPEWKRTHTTLARKLRRWLCEHVAINDWVPSTEELAVALGCGEDRLTVVLAALVRDGTLRLAAAGCYIRNPVDKEIL